MKINAKQMKTNENQWKSMNINEKQWNTWTSIKIYEHEWNSTKTNKRKQWNSMKLTETQRSSMKINENQWTSMKINEHQFAGPWPRACQITSSVPLLQQLQKCKKVIKKCTFLQKWIQKLPIPGKGLRNGPRNEPMLLFLAQTIVSCSENLWNCGAPQGVPAIGIGTCLSLAGHPFSEQFLEALFWLKIRLLDRFWLPKSIQNGSEFLFFLHVFSMSFLEVFRKFLLLNLLFQSVLWICQFWRRTLSFTVAFWLRGFARKLWKVARMSSNMALKADQKSMKNRPKMPLKCDFFRYGFWHPSWHPSWIDFGTI